VGLWELLPSGTLALALTPSTVAECRRLPVFLYLVQNAGHSTIPSRMRALVVTCLLEMRSAPCCTGLIRVGLGFGRFLPLSVEDGRPRASAEGPVACTSPLPRRLDTRLVLALVLAPRPRRPPRRARRHSGVWGEGGPVRTFHDLGPCPMTRLNSSSASPSLTEYPLDAPPTTPSTMFAGTGGGGWDWQFESEMSFGALMCCGSRSTRSWVRGGDKYSSPLPRT